MEKYLGRFSPHIYAILRIVVGFVFLTYGTQKLFNVPPHPAPPPSQPGGTAPAPAAPASLPPLIMVAAIIELVCGLLLLLGLLTGWAAFLASGEMAVAYFMGHFPQHPMPVTNQGVPAVLFCFIFLYIASVGSGIWSVDSLIRKKEPLTRLSRVISFQRLEKNCA